MKDFFKKNKKEILGILFFVLIVIPVVINLCVINNGCYSKASEDGWASFFGSYLGGVIGGGATLIAVLVTISYNRQEMDRRDKKERDNQIRKSAIIVYYDFKFAFDNIIRFLNAYEDKKMRSDSSYNMVDFIDEEFTRKYLDQLYFYKDWIENVAELIECKSFSYNDIKSLYENYGLLLTTKKLVEDNDGKVRYEAVEKMKNFLVKSSRKEESEKQTKYIITYDLKKEVKELMNKLDEIANPKDENK